MTPERPTAAAAASDEAERVQRVLRERAAALARPAAQPDPDEVMEVLVFEVGAQRFAVETSHVREVLRRPQLASVGGSVPGAVGVANLRGTLLPVVDLTALAGVEGSTGDRVLVLDGAGPPLGLLVDTLHDIVALPVAEITSPAGHAGPTADLVRGVTPRMVVLDGERILTDARLFATDHRSS